MLQNFLDGLFKNDQGKRHSIYIWQELDKITYVKKMQIGQVIREEEEKVEKKFKLEV